MEPVLSLHVFFSGFLTGLLRDLLSSSLSVLRFWWVMFNSDAAQYTASHSSCAVLAVIVVMLVTICCFLVLLYYFYYPMGKAHCNGVIFWEFYLHSFDSVYCLGLLCNSSNCWSIWSSFTIGWSYKDRISLQVCFSVIFIYYSCC